MGGGVVPYAHSASYVVFVTGLFFCGHFGMAPGLLGCPMEETRRSRDLLAPRSHFCVCGMSTPSRSQNRYAVVVNDGKGLRLPREAHRCTHGTLQPPDPHGVSSPLAPACHCPPPGARMLLWNELRS